MIARRTLIVGLLLAGTAPPMRVSAQETSLDEWTIYTRLTELFQQLRTAFKPIADGIDRDKFLALLRSINLSLFDIRRSKIAIRNNLGQTVCQGGGGTALAAAISESVVLKGHLQNLAAKSRKLEAAVGPASARAAAATVADQLDQLVNLKGQWIYSVDTYCYLQPNARTAYIARIVRSYNAMSETRNALHALIATLA